MSKTVKIERYKGSGPGGQNRNKRETAIRVTDTASGIQATATERRTQGQNLKIALERLEEKIEFANRRPKKRHKTKPSRRSKEKRLSSKKMHSSKKASRRSSYSD